MWWRSSESNLIDAALGALIAPRRNRWLVLQRISVNLDY